MKKTTLVLVAFILACSGISAQGFKNILKKDSANKNPVQKILSGSGKGLSSDDIAAGLKEALSVGTNKASQRLSNADGFFKDAAIMVLMPPEAKNAEKKLRALGMGKLVDDAILAMNRGAEDAAKSAAPIFLDAIKQMTIKDASTILQGGDFAATTYLKDKTTGALTQSFKPVIESSLKKVDATKYWNAVFTAYNKVSTEKVNTDLSAYVTEKALYGIFYQVGQEEQKIRQDPAARVSDLLKKVFAK